MELFAPLETIAYKKICKIHRKLPQGGILVFLTGKKEIVRMVNRLRRALNGKTKVKQSRCTGSGDVTMPNFCIGDDSGPRELDDEELDADDVADDYEEFEEDDGDVEPEQTSETDDNLPEHAYILPLYSLLSADEQAKVFAPVPEGHRLIVIATNIAETSITIPGISYVVDTGRQKCRNYSSGTGVASYDVMWISKAAAGKLFGGRVYRRRAAKTQSDRLPICLGFFVLPFQYLCFGHYFITLILIFRSLQRSTRWSSWSDWSRTLLSTVLKQLVRSPHGPFCSPRSANTPIRGRGACHESA